jgi:hypothetical protein
MDSTFHDLYIKYVDNCFHILDKNFKEDIKNKKIDEYIKQLAYHRFLYEGFLLFCNVYPERPRFPDLSVRKSKIHGIGVFSNEDINEDIILTIYPCHHICIEDENNIWKLIRITDKDTKCDNKKLESYIIDTNCKYKNKSIGIIGNPDIVVEKQLGHIVNHQPDNYANAKFHKIDRIVYIKSTRKIMKDQEIFVNYGEIFMKNFHNITIL